MHHPDKGEKIRVSQWSQYNVKDFNRCLISLGEDCIKILKKKWSEMGTSDHRATGDRDIGDGILLCLRKIGLSNLDLWSILPVGGSRTSGIQGIE